MFLQSTLEQEVSELTFSQKEFLRALSVPSSSLSIKQIREKTRLSRAWVYETYKELKQRGYVTKKLTKKGTKKGQRSIVIFELTDKGKKASSHLYNFYPSVGLSYAIDLGSKGELSLSFDAPTSEDKYRYEAYWLANPPLITSFLRVVDFDKPTKINVSLQISIPSISKHIIDATHFFAFLEDKMCIKQYWFWKKNINWLETSIAKGQDVWDTPYKDVAEACDLLTKSSFFIFVAMMLGLTSARKSNEIYHQAILLGSKKSEIYNLNFAPLNIFEFLLRIVDRTKKGEKLFSEDHLGMVIFHKLLSRPEVEKWIKRCLKRDGRNWLSRIPFEKLGFKRDKEHISDGWIFDTIFPLSLGVFFSTEKEKWCHIGALMNIFLDAITLKKLPSCLGDELNYQSYTDDVILEAWDRVKGFWQELQRNRKLKRRISRRAHTSYKNRVNPQFLEKFLKEQKKLRRACCEFFETVNRIWKKQGKEVKGTRELSIYLPGKAGFLRLQELNPRLSRYKTIRKTIEDNTQAISSGKRLLRILGSRRKRQKMIATEEYDPDKELSDYVEKLDYDDLMNKLAELSKSCPPYVDHS